jgi:iron complex outermembrane receptor protein
MNRFSVGAVQIVGAFSLAALCLSGEAWSQTPPANPPATPEETPPADQPASNTPPAGESPAAPDVTGATAPPAAPVPPPVPAAPPPPPAQDEPEVVIPPEEGAIESSDSEVIVIVGSRRQVRTKTDTLAPVDVLDVADLEAQGASDMGDMLRTLVPGFNLNEQPISDAATLIRPSNLRGLPPDMTVVLVNGKRRHRGAVISFLGGGVSDGSQGVDTSVIPSIALSQVEVLRDGAAAQYGADAIAGVINFVLRKNREGVRFQAQYGSTYEGDGDTIQVAGNWGLPLTDKGFLNVSAEYSTSDPTNRSVQRADAQELRDNGNLAVADPAQIWGAPEVTDNVKLFFNAGIDVGENGHTYLFGNYARRSVLGGFYYRNPTNRGGVYSNDGGMTYLVGDLTPTDGVACPTVPVGNDALLQQVMDDPNCFVFNELFPGGFTPQFGGDVSDLSLVGGVRGEEDWGLRWDLSGGVGQSEAEFLIKNTVNASLGPDTPTTFNPGTYRQTDQNVNIDVVYPLRTAIDVNVAAGLEYREEKFTVSEGDRASFEIGPLFDQGFSIGSNGFPGFSTDQAGTFRRRNVAGYVDVEGNFVPGLSQLLTGLAVRVENFDTFGSTFNGKFSNRYTVLENAGAVNTLALRAMVGTGFRAPTPGQANVTNVTTVFDPVAQQLINRGTIPSTNPIAQAVGGKELEPEDSINVAAGLIARVINDLSFTTDFYYIKINDRISQSGDQMLTPEQAAELERSGVPGATDLETFRFFTNAFDTTTVGIDVVGTYELNQTQLGRSLLSLAYNYNRTRVDSFTEGVINDQRIDEIQTGLPKHRFVVSATQIYQRLRFLGRASFYSSFRDVDNTPDFFYSPQVIADFEASYQLSDTLTLIMGVQNAFNSFPEESPIATSVGNKYPENAPGGTSGGFWYTRLEARL